MFRLPLKYVPRFVGLLFLYAGVHKMLYPGEATLALYSLDLPFVLANALVTTVIILEFYLGVILVLKIDLKYALTLSMSLMFLFTVYMWYLSTLANPPSCGCLGLTGIFRSNKQAALFGLCRNVVILWLLKLSYNYYFKTPEVAAQRELKVEN